MSTLKRILFVIMILASGFIGVVLWGAATTLFRWGVYDLGIVLVAILVVLIVCNVLVIVLSEDDR